MNISRETELIVKLKHLPGFGPKNVELVSKAMIDLGLFRDSDIEAYVQQCIKTNYIRLNNKLTSEQYKNSIDAAKKNIDLSLNNNIFIISQYDSIFPKQLKELKSYSNGKFKNVAPLLLNYKGDINGINDRKSIAIIGTRKPTSEGEEAGTYYGRFFAEKGYNIVSGLALGCDTIAHKATLNVHNGTTTAILAHGLHMISPKAHEKIAEEIIEKGGVLLSEYFYGTPAYKTYFVERDRLQAGLAIATIVIQTGIEGGTMHAVQATIDNNKILAVVSYREPKVRELENVCGNDYLIKRGAFPLRDANTLYDFLQSEQKLQYKPKDLEMRFNF
ncbi:DNA-processing protein DprA [Bacteroides intestinalis]|uniref:DNA-processing protein DprA n=1 Tax=Bacteroides intestinalis TaxID=329854 RepID=A0A412XVB8_9BACE|nr:DNA-processing protein DprA [Bacteroides intestinalis]RGV49021.1 DNA-processing protein DprA [Bacteroides intestinalis]